MAEAGVEEREQGRQQGHLQQDLKRRHMTMISLGGIIGAVLFVIGLWPGEAEAWASRTSTTRAGSSPTAVW